MCLLWRRQQYPAAVLISAAWFSERQTLQECTANVAGGCGDCSCSIQPAGSVEGGAGNKGGDLAAHTGENLRAATLDLPRCFFLVRATPGQCTCGGGGSGLCNNVTLFQLPQIWLGLNITTLLRRWWWALLRYLHLLSSVKKCCLLTNNRFKVKKYLEY